jgi:uncharacterized protein
MEKHDINEREAYNKLLSIYGDCLSPLEKQDLLAYYSEDLSLSEIALNRHVSRNAVHLSIKHGETELKKYEEKMQVLTRSSALIEMIDKLKEEKDPNKVQEGLDKISEVLNHGI